MNIKFIRFGGLSPVIQEGYGEDGYHAPPARKGFYAFPETTIERFLLGSNVFDQRRMVKIDPSKVKKDEYGYPHGAVRWKDNKSAKFFDENYDKMSDDELKEYRNKNQCYTKHCKPKKFEYHGNIWHHLQTRDVIKQKGSWVLSNYQSWLKAFRKEYAFHKTSLVTAFTRYSKDHFEVFIERI